MLLLNSEKLHTCPNIGLEPRGSKCRDDRNSNKPVCDHSVDSWSLLINEDNRGVTLSLKTRLLTRLGLFALFF